MRIVRHTFVVFLVVGMVNTCIGVSIMLLLMHWAHINYWPATFLGNAAGVCSSYVLNRRYTFRSQASVSESFGRFIVVIGACYFIAYGFSRGTLEWLHIPSQELAVLLGATCYTLLNYYGQRRYVFVRN